MGAPLLLVVLSAGVPGGLSGRLGQTGYLEGLDRNLAALDRMTGEGGIGPSLGSMLWTSTLMAFGVAFLTTAAAFLAAYAMTHFRNPAARLWFGLTLLTLYFPVEARMLPTFDVATRLGLVNTLAGLVLPVLPMAVACFFFRQHLKGLPPEVMEAARLDGAGPARYLRDFLVPLSLVPIGAVFVITFILGWNQYLWPLMISIDNAHFPLMRGLNLTGSGSGPSMVIALVSIGPPLALMLAFLALLRRSPLKAEPR